MIRSIAQFAACLFVSALLCGASRASAVTDAEFNALHDKMVMLEARIQQLEADKASAEVKTKAVVAAGPVPGSAAAVATAAPVAPIADPASWAQRIAVKGDFRVRHDRLDAENANAQERERLRARIGITAKVNDATQVVLGLASGNNDPISRNQTFGDGQSTKGINLEQAFVLWAPKDFAGLEVSAGKFKQTFRNVGDAALLFDADLNPEGLAVKYSRDMALGQFFASGASWWIEEHATSRESVMLGGQAGFAWKLGDSGFRLTTGAGFYNYRDVQGRTPFFDANRRGNTLLTGKYRYGYRDTELFAELKGTIAGAPASAYTDWVRNGDAGSFDTGFVAGVQTTVHGVTLGYAWKRLEADAVLGTFADSDFGSGGTDTRGHIFNIGFDLTQNAAFKLAWYKVQNGHDAGTAHRVDRIQADVNFKF